LLILHCGIEFHFVLLASLLFKTVHTYMVKLMKQKKVKTRMTPSKSRMAFRRTRNEKRSEFMFSKKKTECTKNRFLTLHYANNDRHKRALLSVKVKLMKQKKVKMRMTRNKSRWALRRTRDEK
ncbi:hypothetical protein T4C_10484, partial [Trichinella pseudospiralis]